MKKIIIHMLRMSSRAPQTMGQILEISVAGQKCLCVSGKVVLWSKHFGTMNTPRQGPKTEVCQRAIAGKLRPLTFRTPGSKLRPLRFAPRRRRRIQYLAKSISMVYPTKQTRTDISRLAHKSVNQCVSFYTNLVLFIL